MLKISRHTIAIASLSALAGLYSGPAAAQVEPYIGQVMCAGFTFAPRGWAEMNGQILPIAQNTALFSLIGTMYGGNGQTTFALPDMRGRAILHVGQGTGLTERWQGEQSGSEANTLSIGQLPPHAHSFAPLGSTLDATSVSPAGKVAASKARTTLYAEPQPANLVAMTPSVTSTAGGGQPVNNMQPYLTLRCFIALEGIYPSRN
jgi:microcystin-dependent protein